MNNALKKISERDATLDVEGIANLLQTGLHIENTDGKDNGAMENLEKLSLLKEIPKKLK